MVSISAWIRHFRGVASNRLKPFRFFFPLPRVVHRIALWIAIARLRSSVKRTGITWEGHLEMIVLGIPKSASSSLVHHFRRNLGDVSAGGSFVFAKNIGAIKQAVQSGHLPQVAHLGHQSPKVLVRAKLISISTLNSLPSIAVDRPELGRISSAYSYLRGLRYFPRGWTDGQISTWLRLFGPPNPAHHHTGLFYGPQIHLANSSSWLEPDDWNGPNQVIPISDLAKGVLNALSLLVDKPYVQEDLVLNPKTYRQ